MRSPYNREYRGDKWDLGSDWTHFVRCKAAWYRKFTKIEVTEVRNGHSDD